MSAESGEVIAGHVRWAETGSRDRMRPGTLPAEKRRFCGRPMNLGGIFLVDLRRFPSIVLSIVYKPHPRGMKPFPLGAQ
ncbi:MAG: hypothetical protein CO109_09265 [Deltaproteobacteria bacterium CG_4_9_14_3_um_filter_65_9]|nr:MAG: hypothetical protein CO109_09265 [Deltaproteobacteria bacterium CG_4_9_14_3_um_filter_65_9]